MAAHAPGEAAPPARRWPAEWEPQAALWLAWPHAPETWPGRLEAVEDCYAEFVRVLQRRTPLYVAVDGDTREERARHRLRQRGVDPDAGLVFVEIATDDAWLRDTGPIFVAEGDRQVALDFRFDSWGGKYPPWDRDDRVAAQVAAHMGVRVERVDSVLEGGAIDRAIAGHERRRLGVGVAEALEQVGELVVHGVRCWFAASLRPDRCRDRRRAGGASRCSRAAGRSAWPCGRRSS